MSDVDTKYFIRKGFISAKKIKDAGLVEKNFDRYRRINNVGLPRSANERRSSTSESKWSGEMMVVNRRCSRIDIAI